MTIPTRGILAIISVGGMNLNVYRLSLIRAWNLSLTSLLLDEEYVNRTLHYREALPLSRGSERRGRVLAQ
jgi:hypothetical protein